MRDELVQVKRAVDNNEQKSRNINLLIHGVDEAEDENTDEICLDVIKNSVGVEIGIDAIERTHRVGVKKSSMNTRNSKSKCRPIIFRFSSMRTRMEVYRRKKSLKGKRVAITESLTPARYALLQKAKKEYGKENCWTSEGRVLAKVGTKVLHLQSDSDFT